MYSSVISVKWQTATAAHSPLPSRSKKNPGQIFEENLTRRNLLLPSPKCQTSLFLRWRSKYPYGDPRLLLASLRIALFCWDDLISIAITCYRVSSIFYCKNMFVYGLLLWLAVFINNRSTIQTQFMSLLVRSCPGSVCVHVGFLWFSPPQRVSYIF